MSRSYTPEEVRAMIADKKWIMRYNFLGAVFDSSTEKVLYLESYGPSNGFFIEGWRALHYPLTSELVEKSWREGHYTIALLHQGKTTLSIAPSFSPFGISRCAVSDETITLEFSGIGGAGVSAAYSRGSANGVLSTTIREHGGGALNGSSTIVLPKKRMLLIGVDDTDNDTEGATYALVHNIANDAAAITNTWYATHGNVQLYPYNKHKTRNCFATVVGFIFETDSQKRALIAHFKHQLARYTVLQNTAMASYEGFCFEDQFIDYAHSLKFRFTDDMPELKRYAKRQKVSLHVITGPRGLFGAVASLAFFDRPDYAAKLPTLLT